MKFVPNSVSRLVGRTVLKTSKVSPTILFVGGVTGVVASTVLACRATLRLEDVVVTAQRDLNSFELIKARRGDEYSEQEENADKLHVYVRTANDIAKMYAPAVLIGGVSIAALVGSHRILTKRNVALTAAYAAVDKAFDEYRERVVKELGEEKDRDFRYGREDVELVEDTPKGPKKVQVARASSGQPSQYARFFDESSSAWSPEPHYNQNLLRARQSFATDLLLTRGHLFLNEVYDSLGLPRSAAGSVVGWIVSDDGDNYVDFGMFDSKNQAARDFVNGFESSILLDFNVDGVIYDKI